MASCQYVSIGVWGENVSTGRGDYMNYRISNLTFAFLLSCLFLVLQLPTVVLSEDPGDMVSKTSLTTSTGCTDWAVTSSWMMMMTRPIRIVIWS